MQYDTAQPTQLNTKQYNTVDYTICFLWNLSWPGVKTVLKVERYAQRLTKDIWVMEAPGDGLLLT